MSSRKVIVYIAMSLDGYIAKNDGNLDFLSIVEKEDEDYGYAEFNQTIDCVIVGRKTYDKVLSMGYDFHHADKESYIITRTPRPSIGTVHFYADDLNDLVTRLKSEEGKNIFVDGGAEIVNQLMKENVVDEFIISIIPIFLGGGISLFKDGRPETKLKLLKTKSFEKGLVQLHYMKTTD